ncbi:hypothetical protein [Celeribacter arenosi]
MQDLLRYLTEAALNDAGHEVKAYSIGLDVLGRSSDFDPNSDSIVRVQVGRLRKHLVYYYLTSGRNDPLRLSLPRGTYALEVLTADPDQIADDASEAPSPADLSSKSLAPPQSHSLGTRALVAFSPFSVVQGSENDAALAAEVEADLRVHVAKIDGISVTQTGVTKQDPDLFVNGSLRTVGNRTRVHLELLGPTMETIWGGNITEETSDDPFASQDALLQNLVMELRLRIINAVRAPLSNVPIETLTAWEKYMVSVFAPDRRPNSQAFEQNCVSLLEQAVEDAPDDARVHAALAEKYAYLMNVDPRKDTTEAAEKAEVFVRRANDLDPNSSDVLFNTSLYHWHRGNVPLALNATRRTLELEPFHPLARLHKLCFPFVDRLPDTSLIEEIKAFETRFARDNAARWIALSWITQFYLNRSEYDHAVEFGYLTQETASTPETRMRLAAALVQVGRNEDAQDQIESYLEFWPNLDPAHYASTVIPRRFGTGMVGRELERIYFSLARVVSAKTHLKVIHTGAPNVTKQSR